MKREVVLSVGVGFSTLVLSAQAWAEPFRLEEPLAPACVAAASELESRIERALGGPLPQGLEASVAIGAVGVGYRVTITLRDSAEARGETAIEAPTCDEAVDAAAVVLALAFGQVSLREEAPPASSPRAAESAYAAPEPTLAFTVPLTPADRSRQPASQSDATRLTLATGVDAGTLPRPTLTVGSSLTRSFGSLELAAVARYGLPVADELVETGFSESQRHDFGGLELRACRGVGHTVRVSACAGTEVGAVRASRSFQAQDGSDVDSEHISPRLSGTLAALVAHRGGVIEPGLELAGAAVAVGHDAWLVVRVAGGASVAF